MSQGKTLHVVCIQGILKDALFNRCWMAGLTMNNVCTIHLDIVYMYVQIHAGTHTQHTRTHVTCMFVCCVCMFDVYNEHVHLIYKINVHVHTRIHTTENMYIYAMYMFVLLYVTLNN